MPTNLIIVESPSKARTLSKFLGNGYTIKASMGHVRDLPKSKLGVDVDNGFVPQYEVIKGKEAQIKELRKAAKGATQVFLAADPDREGEAIAWHVAEALGLTDPDRIVFHEITRPAVEAAMSQPRKIDRDLVSAQEARRVIDRLVGYRLSPLLWRKVRTGLSAGRVQSVAVRLVVDRENEIDAFVAKESWTIDAILDKDGDTVTARLFAQRTDGNKVEIGTEAEALEVIRQLGVDAEGKPGRNTPQFKVISVEAKEVTRQAPLPYTTSTLQQDASNRLRIAPKRTMSIAQELYEGVDIGDGHTGLITYMRTDSTRVSDTARDATAKHITGQYGKEYVRKGGPRAPKANPNANVQDAHEAIRPTDVTRTPDQISKHLTPQQAKLYDLIWRRFVASQMAAARFDTTRVDLEAGEWIFRANGSVLRFDGFTRVWRRDDDKEDRSLPSLTTGDALSAVELKREQHFTQPPPRYTEASLIKELEERGIGRPSTYAPTIEVIQDRNYVRQEERRLHPTELGKTVDTLLRQHFPRSSTSPSPPTWRSASTGSRRACASTCPPSPSGTRRSRGPSRPPRTPWSASRCPPRAPVRCVPSAARASWSNAKDASASSSAVPATPTASTSRARTRRRRSPPARCARSAARSWWCARAAAGRSWAAAATRRVATSRATSR
jgi:DNA topoisomerase-1